MTFSQIPAGLNGYDVVKGEAHKNGTIQMIHWDTMI